MRGIFVLISVLLVPLSARAHPVAKGTHDRTIVVRLQHSKQPDHLTLSVDYRLEVDEATVLLEDMLPFKDEVDYVHYRGKPLEYYAEFMRIYAPILADRMIVRVNGKPVVLASTRRTPRLVDEKGQPLGHLRCEFAFEAEVTLPADQDSILTFREANYQLQEGQVLLSFVSDADVQLRALQAPDDALQKRPPREWEPGDEEKLRYLRVVFAPRAATITPPLEVKAGPGPAPSTDADRAASEVFNEETSLLWLVASEHSWWWKLMLATLFGAAHALTPGHGKTLVAAYLIGQRGTVWHALVLGIVTTITHTGALLIIAAILYLLPEHLQEGFKGWLSKGLGLAAGLMIVCLGMWLLLQRLNGRADHVHLGGGHDHSHSHSHSHGGHSHSHGLDPSGGVSWWGLIVLGITGGMIPCVDAIGLIAFFVARGEFWIVLPALICFSAGLAGVLVLIGVLVVQMPKFAKSRLGEGRLVQALPLVSAVVIVLMGFWLCYKGTR